MAIRQPLTGILDYNDAGQTGTTSVAGGVAKTFMLPQDTDNVVVKLTASVIAGGVSAVFQTTDDGSTWYDVARTSVVSNTATNTLAEWLNISTTTPGYRSTVVGQSSVAGNTNVAIAMNTIGSAGASTLGSAQSSGMPILGQFNRIFLRYSAAVSATDLARVQVLVNNQSASA
jgi:hypothetical protein